MGEGDVVDPACVPLELIKLLARFGIPDTDFGADCGRAVAASAGSDQFAIARDGNREEGPLCPLKA